MPAPETEEDDDDDFYNESVLCLSSDPQVTISILSTDLIYATSSKKSEQVHISQADAFNADLSGETPFFLQL